MTYSKKHPIQFIKVDHFMTPETPANGSPASPEGKGEYILFIYFL